MYCKALAVCALVIPALAGCSSFDALRFRPSSLSGAAGGDVAVGFLPESASDLGSKFPGDVKSALKDDADYQAATNASCKSSTKLAAGAAPILAALAQLGFEAWADRAQRRIQAIVDAARVAYSVTTVLGPKDLYGTTCIVVVRYGPKADRQALVKAIVLMRLKSYGTAGPSGAASETFTMTPVFVRFGDAVAVTKEGADGSSGIDVFAAVSVKAVGRQQSSISRLLPTGETVVSVANVKLGSRGPARCVAPAICKESDLIPYPTDAGPLSVTLSIVEQGSTGFDDKAALAELEALKAALGPAIAEAVKAKLEP